MWQAKHFIHLLVLLVVTGLLVQGCGFTKLQKEGINTFGQAAASLGTTSKEQLIAGRSNVIDMKRYRLAIEKKILSSEGSPDREKFAKQLNLDSGLDPDNMDKRIKAIELLTSYGELLEAFTGDTQEKELTVAASKFTDSIKSFPSNPLSTEEINGIGQVVVVAGKLLVEHEKKEAIKKVVPMVSPLINTLCDLLDKDFDPQKLGITGNIYQAQDRLASEAIDGLKRPIESISDRLILIDGFALADKNRDALAENSAKVRKAVASLRKANLSLLELVTGDQHMSLKQAVTEIKGFSSDATTLAKSVKSFL